MRLSTAIAVAALAFLDFPAAHAAPTAKPAPAAKPDASAQAYAAMPENERIAIQSDLIWTGDYNGVAEATFGPRAIAAVKAFQKKLKAAETGVLDAKQRASLAAAAKKRRDTVGWAAFVDPPTGVYLGLPAKLTPFAQQIVAGSRWASGRGEVAVETFRVAAPGTTLKGYFEQYQKVPNRKANYTLLRPDFFVVSGLQSGVKKFYTRAQFKDGQVRGFTILYDQAMEVQVDPVVIAMSSVFRAFPGSDVAWSPPPRKRVEYGSAVLVNESGYAVTTQTLVDGCTVVMLSGRGPADVVANDKASNLALLRVYGAGAIAPLGLAGAGAAEPVVLAGVKDPAAQGGGSAGSLTRVRLKPVASGAATLEPVPAAGFDGAAVLDAGGRLAGIVDVPLPTGPGAVPPPRVIPASAIGTFLTANKVAPSDAARTTPDGQIAAVARVICTRK